MSGLVSLSSSFQLECGGQRSRAKDLAIGSNSIVSSKSEIKHSGETRKTNELKSCESISEIEIIDELHQRVPSNPPQIAVWNCLYSG